MAAWLLLLGGVVQWEWRSLDGVMPRKAERAGWSFVWVDAQAVGVGSRAPSHPPVDTVRIEAGWMMVHEFRVRDYCRWLNTLGDRARQDHPQVEWVAESWQARAGLADHPVAYVGAAESARVCLWVGEQSGLGGRGRLPREAEWLVAARAGAPGISFTWGFAPAAVERACFDADSARDVASYPPNGWGVFDGCGNVAEWCRDNVAPEKVFLKGGSFAERDPRYLRLAHRVNVDAGYANADAGFRVWVTDSPTEQRL